MKDWFHLPEQFRIVFTRNVTNSSSKQAIVKGAGSELNPKKQTPNIKQPL